MSSFAIAKKMMQVIGILALVVVAGGAVYFRSAELFPFALGVALTSAVNVIRVVLLHRSVEVAIGMEDGKSAGNYIRLQFLPRYILMGAALAAAALLDFINLWGAVIGLFTMPVAAYAMQFISKGDSQHGF